VRLASTYHNLMNSNKEEDKANVQLDEAGYDEGESGNELSARHLSERSHRETNLLEAWVDKTLKNLEKFGDGYYCTNFVIAWEMDSVPLSVFAN
jgi:hypothetical protein